MKIDYKNVPYSNLIALRNLTCCFSCFIVCTCFCWGRTKAAMWCYCL